LAAIEETDLNVKKSGNMVAYNRIKDWVTSRQLPIHRKNKTPYLVNNSCHFVQCSNDRNACPIFPGDTRIMMIHVKEVDPMVRIPKKQMLAALETEAPDFLAIILAVEVPPSNDRLNVPVIMTEDKMQAQESNMNPVELFIKEKCYPAQGERVLYKEFYERFYEWVDPAYHAEWTKIHVGRKLPTEYPKGKWPNDAKYYIGNLSFEPLPPDYDFKPRLVRRDEHLVHITTINGQNIARKT
jgi:hypothetical protein